MAQIKATSVAVNAEGSLYVVDDKGRLWLKAHINNQWGQEELPEAPAPSPQPPMEPVDL